MSSPSNLPPLLQTPFHAAFPPDHSPRIRNEPGGGPGSAAAGARRAPSSASPRRRWATWTPWPASSTSTRARPFGGPPPFATLCNSAALYGSLHWFFMILCDSEFAVFRGLLLGPALLAGLPESFPPPSPRTRASAQRPIRLPQFFIISRPALWAPPPTPHSLNLILPQRASHPPPSCAASNLFVWPRGLSPRPPRSARCAPTHNSPHRGGGCGDGARRRAAQVHGGAVVADHLQQAAALPLGLR